MSTSALIYWMRFRGDGSSNNKEERGLTKREAECAQVRVTMLK